MEGSAVFDFFYKLNSDSLSFLYHGFFHDDFTDKIIDLSESNIVKSKTSLAEKNKVSFLIAELFQNIVRHGENEINNSFEAENSGIFAIRKTGNHYYISSANLVDDTHINTITEKLSKVNQLDKDELKNLYMQILDTSNYSEKGGAGLGLIQMAAKSGNKLEYNFSKAHDGHSFFYLQVKIKSKTETENHTDDLPITLVQDLHGHMLKNKICLAYKGDFNQDNIVTLLHIIEKNLQKNIYHQNGLRTKIFHVLTELLQNISKHGYAAANCKEGIFVIGKSSGLFHISTGNYIENNKIMHVISIIDHVNNHTKEQLHKMYLERLKNGEVDQDGNAGLGFIEIARVCKGIIHYQTIELNSQYSFLTLSIDI